MYETIRKKISIGKWCKDDPRFWRLECLDRLLDGTFYNHLPHSFYEETEDKAGHGEHMVKMEDRRPAVQFHIPSMVARMTARKLFSGRHVPRIYHKDAAVKKKIKQLCRRADLYRVMGEIVFRGSVGSVVATFGIHGENKKKPRVKITVWKSKYCTPTFDPNGDLKELVVCYVTDAAQFACLGFTSLDPGSYWFRRKWTTQEDVIYEPVKLADWDPLTGQFSDAAIAKGWKASEDNSEKHEIGFVPAHWFVNLTGGEKPDGASTWAEAIPTAIDIDYTLSQIGRGVRYNAAPQVVTIGDLLNNGGLSSDPMAVLQFGAGEKGEDGETVGRGDAKLLEMTGNGIKASLEYVEALRKYALEQIQAARKDPEAMKGPMSGRAMEYLDDEWHDLVMELRESYGECGMLPLLKKMIAGCSIYSGANEDPGVDGLRLRWPRMFQPTPADLQQIIPALCMAMNPLQQKPPTGGTGPDAAPPANDGQIVIDESEQLLTRDECRAWLKDNMDLGIYDDDEDDDEDDDDGGQEPDEEEDPRAPAPSPDGGGLTDEVGGIGDPVADATVGNA